MARRLDASLLRLSVEAFLEQRRRILSLFEREEFQALVQKFLSQKEVRQLQERCGVVAPFAKLLEKCKASAERLKEGEVSICVYGRRRVGKSTLIKLLLDQDGAQGSNGAVQLPSSSEFVNLTFSSGARDPLASGYVQFSPIISEERGICDYYFESAPDPPDEVLKFRELLLALWRNGGAIPSEMLQAVMPELLHPPDAFRGGRHAAVTGLSVVQPIWGVSRAGVSITDCAFDGGSGTVSPTAKILCSKSTVVIWVHSLEAGLESDGESAQYARTLLDQNVDVLCLVNLRRRASCAELDAFREQLERHALSSLSVHCVNLAEPGRKNLSKLQFELSSIARKRTQSMLALFLNNFSELIRVQHLFASRLLAVRMRQATEELNAKRLVPSVCAATRTVSEKQLVDARLVLASILSAAKSDIAAYERGFDEIWRAAVRDWHQEREKSLVDDDPSVWRDDDRASRARPQNILRALVEGFSPFSPARHSPQSLYGDFVDYFSHRLIEYLASATREFAEKLARNARNLQADLLNLKSNQAKSIWNAQIGVIYTAVQSSVYSTIHHLIPFSVAMTSVLGSAIVVSIFFTGMITAAVLTAGIATMATLGISAGSLAIYNATKKESAPQARQRLLGRVRDQLLNLSGSQYESLRKKCLGSLHGILNDVVETFEVDLLSIETIARVEKLKIDSNYDSVCSYLWIREECNAMIQNLAEEFYIRKEGVAKLSSQIKLGAEPESCCYVCSKTRHACGHLCRDCDFILNGQCPCCYEQPSWIAAKIKLPKEGSELNAILKSVSVAMEGDAARDSLVKQDRPEASLVISYFDAEISHFGAWFNSKYPLHPHAGHSLAVVKEIQNSVNYFVNETLRNLALAGKYTYAFKQSILASLHRKLFLHIGQRFIKAHRQLWATSDRKNFAFCSKYNANHPPHRAPAKGAKSPHDGIDKAAKTISRLNAAMSPHEKFSLVKNSWELALTSQFDPTDTDSLWDTIKLALIRASYRYLLSDIDMMNACLRPFLEVHDSYILIVTTGIAKTLKEIASYEEKEPTDDSHDAAPAPRAPNDHP